MAEEDQYATMAQVKGLVRRKQKKFPEVEEQGLNIYPMMDMMTILLVFMVMQFASSSAAAIQQNDELQIPYSTSQTEMGEALLVIVSRAEIVVDGEHIVDLRNGQVDPSDKQGGSTGFLITPLYRRLGEVRDLQKLIEQRNPARPFLGEVQIVADGRTPFRTLAELIYTLGQTEFSTLRFVTNKRSGAAAPAPAEE